MYKLVIVEDEQQIRHGLEKFIDWNSMGFEVAGTFEDGESALEHIKDNPCDVVMTDVMMKKMTGLDLIGKLIELFPDIKTVIVSGYDDFIYTRQAIKYKVIDYLLKPIDEQELCEVFKKIKEELVDDYEVRLSRIPTEELFASSYELDTNSGGESIISKIIDYRYKTLLAALNMEDIEHLYRVIDEIVEESKKLTIDEIRMMLKKIYYMISNEFNQRKIDVIKITDGKFNYNSLLDVRNHCEFERCIKKSFTYVLEGIKGRKVDYGSGSVVGIMEYVEAHVSMELCNEVVADKFRMNPAYLCRMFKEKTGENLSDYIARVRMKKAGELLKSEKLKVADVWQMLGYSSGSYFSVQFKKYTGYTPSEYIIRTIKR